MSNERQKQCSKRMQYLLDKADIAYSGGSHDQADLSGKWQNAKSSKSLNYDQFPRTSLLQNLVKQQLMAERSHPMMSDQQNRQQDLNVLEQWQNAMRQTGAGMNSLPCISPTVRFHCPTCFWQDSCDLASRSICDIKAVRKQHKHLSMQPTKEHTCMLHYIWRWEECKFKLLSCKLC